MNIGGAARKRDQTINATRLEYIYVGCMFVYDFVPIA